MDVAIRDAMVSEVEGRPFFQSVRDAGVKAIEIEVLPDYSTPHLRTDGGSPHSLRDDASTRRLKATLDAEGVRAAALLVSTDFSSAAPDRQVEWAVRVVGSARTLRTPVVRIDPLPGDKSLSAGDSRDRFIAATERLLRRTEDTGVDLGMENHGPFANDPLFIDAVLAALPDGRLGLTLDTGNFYWFGFPLDSVYELIEKYAPAAKHTHIKNINYPPDVARRRREIGYGYEQACCGVHEGNLDLRRVVRILRDGGYERDLCVEDESLFKHPPAQRLEVLRREAAALREALNGAAA